jgi:hypothetical protein
MEYKVVARTDINEFSTAVTAYLQKGFTLHGEMQVLKVNDVMRATFTFMQAMVKA